MDFRSLNVQDADAEESFDAPLRGNASSNRPRPLNPFGSRNASWLGAALGCLTTLMDFMGKLLTSLQPPPSIRLNDKTYTIVKQLGEGGHYGDPKALKRIKIQLPEQEERLLKEIAAHGIVSSPHVLKLLDSMTVKNASGQITEGLLLLPFFKNGTVQDLIDRTMPSDFIPFQIILKITIGVCKGLAAFQSQGKDLAKMYNTHQQPANILIDDQGEAVLMDLGSVTTARLSLSSRKDAIALQDLCAETVTAPFRAPELFDPPSQGMIDESTDIWYAKKMI